jgi:DNA modification methylase
MQPYTKLLLGNCLKQMAQLSDNSIDSIVTDPPYGLSFMGKKWDYDVPSVEIWSECLRVLKPGGHLLAFAGTRTQHRMAVNIEDAGFEIRDMIAWVYGSGFPKSLDISKAIDKSLGTEKIVGKGKAGKTALGQSSGYNKTNNPHEYNITEPNSKPAKQWQGWGTALKPALEPITVARKPIKGTVADNVLKWGTGGLNIDECRVGLGEGEDTKRVKGGHKTSYIGGEMKKNYDIENQSDRDLGRFPANLIHDGSDEVVRLFPSGGSGSGSIKVSSGRKSGCGTWAQNNGMQRAGSENTGVRDFGDSGSAARFFYCAKASKSDRGNDNLHPTVKPTDLMRYLVKLVTPPNGIVLDPFMGSGSTGKACVSEGFSFIGIEMEQEYMDIAKARIEREKQKGIQSDLF